MNWPTQPLGLLGRFSAGIAFSPSLQGRVGLELPFAKVGDISIAAKTQNNELRYTRHSVSRADLSKLQGNPVPAGSIIFAKIGEAIKLGNQVSTIRETLIDNNVMAFIPNSMLLNFRYAVHAFQRINMYALADKTTVPAIRKSRLELVHILVPPLEQQKRIAAILDKADSIRRKREQAIQLADQFLRSLFLDMFGDPVSNSKGWPVSTIEAIAKVGSGLQVSHSRTNHLLEVPYLRVANVYRERLDLRTIKSIRVTQDELRRATLEDQDILIVEGHGNPEEIGRSAVWKQDLELCVHQNHLIRVRVRAPHSARFICAVLNSASGREQFLRHRKTTSGLNTISTSNVKAVTTILPPLGLQEYYLSIQNRIRGFQMRNECARDHITCLQLALIQAAFRD